MKIKNIYIFTLFILFNTIFSQNAQFEIFTFDEAVNYINDVPFNKKDYDDMISNLISLLNNRYIFLDIAKNPPPPFKPVDVIEELKSIKTDNIQYYEFYQRVFNILLKPQDAHLQIFFKKILELEYLSPIGYFTRTINNINYLFCGTVNIAQMFFDKSLLNKINENIKYPIKSINGKDPFDFIQTFGRNQKFKSEHAQFTFNINIFSYVGRFHTYPFIKEDLTNIQVEFYNGNKIIFDYKILKPKKMSRKLEEFYKEEMKKYSPDDIIKPTIIEIEQKFIEKNNKIRNLELKYWDLNYRDQLKLKVDYQNKVNVIYQNSFSFSKIENNKIIIDPKSYEFILSMYAKINKNNYPIVIIEDFNGGGFLGIVFFLLNMINPELSINSLNIAIKIVDDNSEHEIDNYGNGIKHKRSKIIKVDFTNIWEIFNKIKGKIRKPNEIIVFTDSFSYSATSLFIKNLQESGNAIIVGYNGNPSEKKKKDKFDSSQGPTTVERFPNDTNVINLNKYGIIVNGISTLESFNDSFVKQNVTPIPREYIINPIDERSNIYGRYFDFRYDEFINEAKLIFNKYKKHCNPDNKNMVLYNPSCKFGNDIQIGGYKCINGKWSDTCQISNCKKPYLFDTYVKRCISRRKEKKSKSSLAKKNKIEIKEKEFYKIINEYLNTEKNNQISNKSRKFLYNW